MPTRAAAANTVQPRNLKRIPTVPIEPPSMPAIPPMKNPPCRPSLAKSDANGTEMKVQPSRNAPQANGAKALLTPSSTAARGAMDTNRHDADVVAAQANASSSSAANIVAGVPVLDL